MSPVTAVRRDQPFPNRLRLTAALVAGVILPFLSAADGDRAGLTIEERLATQKAIEQVYWNHRTWPKENPTPKPSLSAVLSDAAIRARVEDTLRKSNALEKYWHRPITAEQLQAELSRMAANSRNPDILRELFAALGNDPFLIAETLARQTLADRLIRTWYANDERFHGGLKKKAEAALATCQRVECMPSMGGEYHETTWKLEAPEAPTAEGVSHREVIRLDGEEWKGQIGRLAERLGGRPESLPVLKLSGLEETAEALIVTAVLTQGKDEIRTATVTWRKSSFDGWWPTVSDTFTAQVEDAPSQFALPAVASSGCVEDTWAPTWAFGPPFVRVGHSVVWTGTEMIVWGGYANPTYLNTGGRYNPATDTWIPTSTGANVPAGRQSHTAIWTGTEMIIWGGLGGSYLNTGGRYDPSTDTWIPTSVGANVPPVRNNHTAVWTGTEMIVWGGASGGSLLNTGGRYDPSFDTWTPTSTGANVPAARNNHTAVWTGTEMIVWGGVFLGSASNTGGRYDPSTDTWIPTTTKTNAPTARIGHTAVWTGTEMIVWGGHDINLGYVNTGGRYDPSIDNWIPISTGPLARYVHKAVWTGTEMIVWGGYGFGYLNSGGRYNPSTNTWTLTSGANAPAPRDGHTVVWSGTEMIVWGGVGDGSFLNTGGRYEPSTNTWIPTSVGANVPAERYIHSAIWTGSEMIIWGGYNGSIYMNTGGRYDPSTDTWTPTSTGANVPAERYIHSAIWTGTEMIVWGGYHGNYLNTGGRYDPSTDIWTSTSTGANVPFERYGHTAIWTGAEMIVWGGYFAGTYMNTGGRYDPSTDTWIPTSTGANVPAARSGHTTIWAVKQMIVWGGLSTQYENTGGLYCVCPNGVNHYRDVDGDGYGGPVLVGQSCDGSIPPGYSYIPGDCNDANASIHPGASELCNGIDDDCDGAVDEGFDVDRDGFKVCTGDCDDGNATVHPGAAELCDDLDNDCNGTVDGFATSCGLGPCFSTGLCTAGVNSCVPGSPSVEVCDDIDNDCDGAVDEGFDVDGDGFKVCTGDCDDGHATVHPGAAELCDNLDNDCNEVVDGFATSCGLGQCFQTGSCIAGVNSCVPGSPSLEVCDGIDNDCDGYVDDVPVPAGSLSVTLDLTGEAPALGWTTLIDAIGYDVVAGDLLTLFTGGGFTSAVRACLADDIVANSLTLSDAPDLGTGYFYLVRGVTCSGPGTYDEGGQLGSRDFPINASPLSCPQVSPCGDGICSPGEDCSTCPDDCGTCVVCGDGYCDEPYEDCYTCEYDCGSCCTFGCWPD